MKPTPKEAKQIHEHYEKVVAHLIEENYAADREGADKIISGMSDEWYGQSLTDEDLQGVYVRSSTAFGTTCNTCN